MQRPRRNAWIWRQNRSPSTSRRRRVSSRLLQSLQEHAATLAPCAPDVSMPLRARRGPLLAEQKFQAAGCCAQTDISMQRAGEKRQSKFLCCFCLFVAWFLPISPLSSSPYVFQSASHGLTTHIGLSFPSSFALHLRYIDYLCSGQFLLRHIDYVTLHLLLTLHLHLRSTDSFLA